MRYVFGIEWKGREREGEVGRREKRGEGRKKITSCRTELNGVYVSRSVRTKSDSNPCL
jgi:hypothetical protein